MAGDDENFLSRWSRLKREEAAKLAPAVAPGATPAATGPTDATKQAAPPELPPVETLTLESDYRAFLQPNVDLDVRRAALKKLFSDPHFHFDRMDKLDTYIDDYTKFEPISEAMLKTLDHARHILFDQEKPAADAAVQAAAAEKPGGRARDAPQPAAADPQKKNDDPGQDS
jgi:Protein of unknown function (DUF3306)